MSDEQPSIREIATGMLKRYSSPSVAREMALHHAMDYPRNDRRHQRWMAIYHLIIELSS